jgi:tetratricopeptide (TPR) repeat protein
MAPMSPLQLARRWSAFAYPLLIAACTPQAALLMSALPPGTASVVLSNLERVDDTNRTKVAELEARGDWEGLLRVADENLAKQRSNADWWVVAGYANIRLERHARAAECYSEVVRLEPDDAAGWHLLAQSYRAMKQPQRAVTVLDRALLALRDTPVTHFLLGESYSDLKRYAAAAAAYRQALQLDKTFGHAWYGLGRAELNNGHPPQAEQAAKSLEGLDPQLAAALRREIAARR